MSGSLSRIARSTLKRLIKRPSTNTIPCAPWTGPILLLAKANKFDFTRVPDEVIEIILAYIRPGHLCEVVKVNRTFHEVGIRVLYRSIYIHHPHREVSFYRTIFQDHPEYAKYIREFRRAKHLEITCNPKKICRGSGEHVCKVFGMSLRALQARVLSMAVNLVSLEMAFGLLVPFQGEEAPSPDDPKGDPFGHVRWLLDGKVKLKRLIVHPLQTSWGRVYPTQVDMNRFMVTILRAQPTIQHLDISHIPYALKPLDLPHLRSLASGGPYNLRQAATPERPLSKIICTQAIIDDVQTMVKEVALKQGGEHVLELSWQYSLWYAHTRKLDLGYIPSTLTNLRVLRFRLRIREYEELVNNILDMLPLFCHLVELDLGGSGRYDGGSTYCDPSFTNKKLKILSDKDFIDSCQTRCPSLRRITPGNSFYWFRNEGEDTWTCVPPMETRNDHWLLVGDTSLPYTRGVGCVSTGDVMTHP